MVDIYLDETKGFNESFQIDTAIYGDSSNCESFKKAMNEIVQDNKSILKIFNGFHAHELNEKQWKTRGQVYIKVLRKLKEFIDEKKINVLIFIESKEKKANNAIVLKNEFKKGLVQKDSSLSKIYSHLEENDYRAIYERVDQLYIYLLHRDKFGENNEKFNFYPGSSGKILHYKDKSFPLKVSNCDTHPIRFFDIVKITANALSKTLSSLNGWSKSKEQKIINFEPLKDKDNYIIQCCDIVSNFFLNFLRIQLGIHDPIYQLKSDAFSDIFEIDLEKVHSNFKSKEFVDKEDKAFKEVICINHEMRDTITFQ